MRSLGLPPPSVPSPLEREGARLLLELLHGLDIVPLPDGTARLTLECTQDYLERLIVWGAAVGDVENAGELDASGWPAPRDPGLPPAFHSARLAREALSAAELVRRRDIQDGARQALMLLMASRDPAPLPQLVPRPWAARHARGREVWPERSSVQNVPSDPVGCE